MSLVCWAACISQATSGRMDTWIGSGYGFPLGSPPSSIIASRFWASYLGIGSGIWFSAWFSQVLRVCNFIGSLFQNQSIYAGHLFLSAGQIPSENFYRIASSRNCMTTGSSGACSLTYWITSAILLGQFFCWNSLTRWRPVSMRTTLISESVEARSTAERYLFFALRCSLRPIKQMTRLFRARARLFFTTRESC